MENIFNKFLEKHRQHQLTIDCIGDVVIDQYYQVKVSRISQECPVAIMHSENQTPITRPGGVALVAAQFKHFNITPNLIRFPKSFLDNKFHTNVQIPIKKRFLEHTTQIKRWDIETKNYGLTDNQLKTLQQQTIKNYQPAEIAILSDYDKGFFYNFTKEWMELLKNKITIVDPKNGPVEKWQGCTIFKPNSLEANNLSGETDWKKQCLYFKNYCKKVVITQGEQGVVGMDEDFFEYRQKSDKVVSTIGGGDIFASFLAMATGYGFSLFESVQIADYASKVYIQNSLNRPITPGELSPDGIVHPIDLSKRDYKLIFTNGCFDFGLTKGHVEYLQLTKSFGDKLVVALNSDTSIKRLKGENRPIMSLEERMTIVKALKCVDFVTWFEEDTPLEIIKIIMPELVVKGSDYRAEDVAGYGIVPIKIVDLFESTSTSEKIQHSHFTTELL